MLRCCDVREHVSVVGVLVGKNNAKGERAEEICRLELFWGTAGEDWTGWRAWHSKESISSILSSPTLCEMSRNCGLIPSRLTFEHNIPA